MNILSTQSTMPKAMTTLGHLFFLCVVVNWENCLE